MATVVSEQHDLGKINWVAGMTDPGEMIGCGYRPELRRHAGEQDAAYAARIGPLVAALPQNEQDMIRGAAIRRLGVEHRNGKVSVVTRKTPGWHQVGTVVEGDMTTEEAIKHANADYEVALVRLFHQGLNVERSAGHPWSMAAVGQPVPVDANAVVRISDGKVLCDHVGPKYVPLQNREAFKWFDPFLAGGLAKLESAGVLAGGRKIWVLAELNRDPLVIRPGDEVRKYLLLSNSHDGTEAVRCGFTPVRVVCQNTLSAAVGGAQTMLRMRHTANLAQTMEAAQTVIKEVDANYEKVGEAYRHLARKQVRSAAQLETWIKETFALTPAKDDVTKLHPRSQGTLDKILAHMEQSQALGAELLSAHQQRERVDVQAHHLVGSALLESMLEGFETGKPAEAPQGRTWWDAYNAVTAYLSHDRGKDAGARLDSLWTGDSARLSAAALSTALAAAKA